MNKKAILVIAIVAIAVIAVAPIFTRFGEKEIDQRMVVEIGDKSYTAVLYDTDAAKEFAERLPVTIEMNELNGNEKYYNFDEAFTKNDKPAGNIIKGDIKLYGDNCVVLFYDSFLSAYSYTSIGYIEDTAGLESAVGSGNVTVTFKAG